MEMHCRPLCIQRGAPGLENSCLGQATGVNTKTNGTLALMPMGTLWRVREDGLSMVCALILYLKGTARDVKE